MYSIIFMKADYEPWWQFDDMEEKYTEVKTFETYELYEETAIHILEDYRKHYQYMKQQNDKFFAFWNEGDLYYCEGCDEELQQYYGIIFSHEVELFIK